MTPRRWLALLSGVAFILLATLLARLPSDWIERRFFVEPDHGSGALELSLIVLSLIVGVALIGAALHAFSKNRVRQGANDDQEEATSAKALPS